MRKTLLYQAGTRRKLLVDPGTGLTGDTMAAMQPWRFLAKAAHDFKLRTVIAFGKFRTSGKPVHEEAY